MLASFRSCPRKFYLSYMENWKPKSTSEHLHAGSAYAYALEQMRKAYFMLGMDKEEAECEGIRAFIKAWGQCEAPEDSNKTFDRMLGALVYYYDTYPLGLDEALPLQFADGSAGIEFSFAEPLEIPVLPEPILYVGRCDMIASFAGAISRCSPLFVSTLTSPVGSMRKPNAL